MSREYHKCHFCGGKVSEKQITIDYRWGENLVTVIKSVPTGVCEVCGEQYSKAPIVKAMGKVARSKSKILNPSLLHPSQSGPTIFVGLRVRPNSLCFFTLPPSPNRLLREGKAIFYQPSPKTFFME
jgi:YgiT-type zinc finger domain-containing protein